MTLPAANEPMDCKAVTERKKKCYSSHGDRAEKCMIPQLQEKRCRAFLHCAREAKDYYGKPKGEKAICASWEEAICFGNPRIMAVDTGSEKKDRIFQQHQRAKYKINSNREKLKMCREISANLSRCLRKFSSS